MICKSIIVIQIRHTSHNKSNFGMRFSRVSQDFTRYIKISARYEFKSIPTYGNTRMLHQNSIWHTNGGEAGTAVVILFTKRGTMNTYYSFRSIYPQIFVYFILALPNKLLFCKPHQNKRYYIYMFAHTCGYWFKRTKLPVSLIAFTCFHK